MELKDKTSDTWKLTITFGRERLCHPSSVLALSFQPQLLQQRSLLGDSTAQEYAGEWLFQLFLFRGIWITWIISSEACERGLEVWLRLRSSIGVLCLSNHTKFVVSVLCSSELGPLCRVLHSPCWVLVVSGIPFCLQWLGSHSCLKNGVLHFKKQLQATRGVKCGRRACRCSAHHELSANVC